jgi:hypothetical protein
MEAEREPVAKAGAFDAGRVLPPSRLPAPSLDDDGELRLPVLPVVPRADALLDASEDGAGVVAGRDDEAENATDARHVAGDSNARSSRAAFGPSGYTARVSWEKIILTRDQIIAREQIRVMREFAELNKAAGRPPDAALFGSAMPDKNGSIEEYFSPAGARIAAELIQRYGGVPCEKPSAESVSLSHGNPLTAWDLLKS